MRVQVVKVSADGGRERAIKDACSRARDLASKMKEAGDAEARRTIEEADFPAFKYSNRHELCIDEDAWNRVAEIGEEPKMIFAHPDMLRAHPRTSIHYRGIATLPFKRVRNISGVDAKKAEAGDSPLSGENCLKLARLYNTAISTIIADSSDWIARNGYRNILATLGISIDGMIKTMVGSDGESKVRRIILDWLDEQQDITCSEVKSGKTYDLGGKGSAVRMTFAAEPDIKFEVPDAGGWKIVCTIEIKAGTDPAGALERLGAIRKSFEHVPVQSHNFAVLGVVTPEMESRLNDMHIARYFKLADLDGDGRQEFLDEIFHFTLRLNR